MKICRSTESLRQALPLAGKKNVGFVPTMGYLHEGHLSLVRKCRQENDLVVVSIFINPIQFGPNEDLRRYPRDEQRDIALLKKEKTDLLFLPDNDEMYPERYNTYVNVDGLDAVLCGKSRPGHFRGVATVVLKLFNLVNPNRAYFGQKDAQQGIIIKQMVRDLNLPVSIQMLPIVRDGDGLALSSRNVYLSPAERRAAYHLPQALKKAAALIGAGCGAAHVIKNAIAEELSRDSLIAVEYIAMVNPSDLREIPLVEPQNTLIALAIRVGKTRLIDNLLLGDLSC